MSDDIKYIGKDIPSKIAIKDIKKELIDNGITKQGSAGKDFWYVTITDIFGKESRRLNKKLGVHKINKFGLKMGGRK